ncbi:MULTISPECIES: AAA family ATPase [unclassified Fusibacter]|nr:MULTISPECIES: AAA family ATPase [unclassified Fusibacter]MCK8059492.1 AAA family ATPase [Fusibacter sp. A2]NPE21044.1 AAA family ATPase [Fusibacter sp. A1]
MKKLIFICGPNGVGKTTIAKEVLKTVPKTVFENIAY